MKRDFDLIRRILIDVENIPAGGSVSSFIYPEIDQATIDEHVVLLRDAGLIKGELTLPVGVARIYSFRIVGLTWEGHDFLDAMKDDNVWNKAKENVLKPGASVTFDLLLEWLKIQVKQNLGLP